MEGNNILKFKILTCGSSNCGKYQFMRTLQNQKVDPDEIQIGAEFVQKTISINQQNIKLIFWSVEGSERYQYINRIYYKGCNYIIFMYDTANLTSFNQIDYYHSEFKQCKDQSVNSILYLVANNKNPRKVPQVQPEQGMQYAQKNEMNFFEISSETEEGIQSLLKNIAEQRFQKKI